MRMRWALALREARRRPCCRPPMSAPASATHAKTRRAACPPGAIPSTVFDTRQGSIRVGGTRARAPQRQPARAIATGKPGPDFGVLPSGPSLDWPGGGAVRITAAAGLTSGLSRGAPERSPDRRARHPARHDGGDHRARGVARADGACGHPTPSALAAKRGRSAIAALAGGRRVKSTRPAPANEVVGSLRQRPPPAASLL